MKRIVKSLTLNKETLMALEEHQIEVADGARTGTVCTRIGCSTILLTQRC